MAGPYRPTSAQLMRFWLAGPLTCALFTPLLLSGLFGAPSMALVGLPLAWMMLRSGRDSLGSFALAGIAGALAAPLIFGAGLMAMGERDFVEAGSIGFLLGFGVLFGPFAAVTFRMIAGRWRP